MSRLIRAALVAAALGGLVAAGVPTSTPAQEKGKQKEKDAAGKEAVEVFKDKAGDFRWHVTDADGKVVAMTTKGYATKDECLKALAAVKATLNKAKVTEKKEK